MAKLLAELRPIVNFAHGCCLALQRQHICCLNTQVRPGWNNRWAKQSQVHKLQGNGFGAHILNNSNKFDIIQTLFKLVFLGKVSAPKALWLKYCSRFQPGTQFKEWKTIIMTDSWVNSQVNSVQWSASQNDDLYTPPRSASDPNYVIISYCDLNVCIMRLTAFYSIFGISERMKKSRSGQLKCLPIHLGPLRPH